MASQERTDADQNAFDLFHDVVMSEERSQTIGYEEGKMVGERRGLVEGYKLGFQKGASVGSEIGFYTGYIETLQELMSKEDSKPRVVKSLQSLQTMLTEFPVSDVLNESLFEDLEKIRAKFKQVTSLLGIQMAFGEEKKEMSF